VQAREPFPAGPTGFHRARAGHIFAPMTDRPKALQKARQQRRLGAALRENLKRRKAQSKARAGTQECGGKPHDSAGIGEDKQR
jgi:hypothetical protein